MDPKLFVLLRFAAAAPLMLLVTRFFHKPVLSSKSRAVWILGFLNSVAFASQFLGQAYTDASVAALLVNLSFLVAAIGSAALLQERFTKSKLIGTVVAVPGILLLTTGGNLRQLASTRLLGDALYLVSAMAWGIYIIYNKRKTDEEKWDPLGVTSSIILVTAVFTSPMILFSFDSGISLSVTEWLIVGYTALLNTAVPFTLYQYGLRFLPATSSAMLQMLEIITAVTISVAFLGETIGAVAVFGAALIILSIFLVSGAELVRKSLSIPYSNSSEERRVS